MADDAGALLVRSGLVSAGALEDARSRAASQGGTIGEQLVAADVISDDALTEFYRQRLLVPQVNPNTLARLPQKVVAAISADLAIELRAIPVSLDGDNTLTVAMSDPSDRHAVDEISFFTGMYVVRAVATQMQIAWCLAHYYGHITVLGARLVQPQKAAPAPAPEVEAAAAAPAAAPAAPAAPAAARAGSCPSPASRPGQLRVRAECWPRPARRCAGSCGAGPSPPRPPVRPWRCGGRARVRARAPAACASGSTAHWGSRSRCSGWP